MTDQEYLDRCAIEAMKIAYKTLLERPSAIENLQEKGLNPNKCIAGDANELASFMLAERKKRMETEKMKSTEECGDCGFQLVVCPKHDKAMQEWRKE